jgi:serine 3-dehydrogenase
MKTVWITGASSGFGAASVRWFAERGWRVGAWARRADRLAQLRDQVLAVSPGAELWFDTVDVRDAAADQQQSVDNDKTGRLTDGVLWYCFGAFK